MQPGRAALDFGQQCFQHCAQIDRLAQRSGAQQREQRRTARQPLQRSGQFDQRALLCGQFDAQACLILADQPQLRHVGGDLSFGFLHPRRQCSGFLCGAISRRGGSGGTRLKHLGPAARLGPLRLRP